MNTPLYDIPPFVKRIFESRLNFITTVDGWDVYRDTKDLISQPYLVVRDGHAEFPHLHFEAPNLYCPESVLLYLRAHHAMSS